MSVSEPLQVIRSLLLNRTAITAITGTRIYAQELPTSITIDWETPTSVTPTIVIGNVTIDQDNGAPRQNVTAEIMTLGSTALIAQNLAYSIINDLDGVTGIAVGGVIVLTSIASGGPDPEIDAETDWYFSRMTMDFIILG